MKTWAKHLFFRQTIQGRKGSLGKALLDQRFEKVSFLDSKNKILYKGKFFSIKENQPRQNIFAHSKSLFTVGFATEQVFRSFQKTSKYRRLKPCLALGGESDGIIGDEQEGFASSGDRLYGPTDLAVDLKVQGSKGKGLSFATNLNLPFQVHSTKKGLQGTVQHYFQTNSLVQYLNNNTVQQVKVKTKLLYVFMIKILRRYKLQKQSLKYQLAIRNTCKLVLIYVFGSFCWLYLACYSTTKEKFNNRKVGFLFQETVSKNLPLFQKNPSLYTKETVENTVFLSTNVLAPLSTTNSSVPSYAKGAGQEALELSGLSAQVRASAPSVQGPYTEWAYTEGSGPGGRVQVQAQSPSACARDSGSSSMVKKTSTQLIDQISNSSLSGPLVNIKLSSFFRDFSTQNYIGLALIKEKKKHKHLVDTNSENINVFSTQRKVFFARKPLLITQEKNRKVNLKKQKLSHREQYFFSGTSMIMGPEIDFLPRQLKMTRKTLATKIKRANTSKISSIDNCINFSPRLAIAEQLKWCNNLNRKFVFLGEQSPKKLQEKNPWTCTEGARSRPRTFGWIPLSTLLDRRSTERRSWAESAATIKITEKPMGFLFRTLAIKTVPLSRTSGSRDTVIEPRMQSGFNFPDAPIIKKDRENWKNGLAISLKKDLVSNEINYVIPSFAQSSISLFSNPCKELKKIPRHCENKKGLPDKQIKVFSKTPFLELVYRERPLKNNFFTEEFLNPVGAQKPLLQDPQYKSTVNDRVKELWGEVKTFINIIGNQNPSSKIIREKNGQNNSVNFVLLDQNADIKTLNCLLGGEFFKQELTKNGAEVQSSVSTTGITSYGAFSDSGSAPSGPTVLGPKARAPSGPSVQVQAPLEHVQGASAPKPHVQAQVQHLDQRFTPVTQSPSTLGLEPLTYLMPSNCSKVDNLLKISPFQNISEKNLNSLVFSPESFFGSPYLQLGERFTIEKIKSKNQIGVLYNVHNGDIFAPINSNYPFANMGTSLKTVFGKKWLKQQSSIKTAKTQRVTNARLVSKWEVAHLPETKKNFNNFSINSLLEKNLVKMQTNSNKNKQSSNSLRGLLYLKRISGKANGHLINPFKYYNPGTKRERNIEDTMLTLEGYKKSRLFSKIHTYYQGINTGSLPFKLGFYDYFRDSDIDVQSILGGMRQSTESQRRAENITGAPNSNLDELQKNENKTDDFQFSLDNFLENKNTATFEGKDSNSIVKKKKKYSFTNYYPFPTLLVNSSQKSFPKNLKLIDKAEYNFSNFSIEQKPISTYKTNVLKGLGQTKGFYFEKIFINKKLGFAHGPLAHKGRKSEWACAPSGPTVLGPKARAPKVQAPLGYAQGPTMAQLHERELAPLVGLGQRFQHTMQEGAGPATFGLTPLVVNLKVQQQGCKTVDLIPKGFLNKIFLDFSGIIQIEIWGSLTKILFFIAVWSSYRILAIPLSQSTPFLPAAFTEAIGLNSFQQKYRIITREKIRQFKNVAGNEKTLSELRNLIWLFPLVSTRKHSDFLASFPYIGSQAGQQRISLRFKERNRFLLYGPPGTGKTLLARALASEANVPIIVQPVSQLKTIVGVENPVSALFHVARQIKPCIIFLDELDTLGTNLENSTAFVTPEQKLGIRLARKYTYTLLLELDGLTSSTDDLLVIGATNRPETLNPALMRPGRFETIINCSLPDEKQRLAVLSLYLFYYKQKVSTIKTFQSIKSFALKQKARESKSQKQVTNFNGALKKVKRKSLAKIYNKTPWNILSENWLLKRKKQSQFFKEQNNKLFYVNYIAQKCYGLSQASIETIVNESALELMQKRVGSLTYQQHTLKSLERAIESVRILTSQETNNSVFSLFKQNKQAVALVSSTANFFEKTKTSAWSAPIVPTGHLDQVGLTLAHAPAAPEGAKVHGPFGPLGASGARPQFTPAAQAQVGPKQEVAKSWSKTVDCVDSALLDSLPKALRVINGEKNKFIKAHTIKPQLRQFWVNSAYQITGSFILSQKLNCKPSRKIQDLLWTAGPLNEISQQTTKQSLQFLLKKQYAGYASLSLYTTTRPQIIKLSETFGLYKNPANYGTNVLMLENLIGLNVFKSTSRENNFSEFSAFKQEIKHISANTSKDRAYKESLGLAPMVHRPITAISEVLRSKKSYFVPESEFLKLNKTNLLFGSFSSKIKKNLHNNHNNLGFSFQHQIYRQIKLNNWLTTGWFRAYLSRPIFRYDNKEYIENKEYYPQNNYTSVVRRPKSINVSTLAHQPKEFSSNFFKNKNTVLATLKPLTYAPLPHRDTRPQGRQKMHKPSLQAPGSILKVQEGKIFQHKTYIISKQKQIFSENVCDIQSFYLAIVSAAFHQGLLVMQKNRELVDYCVYNILRYGVLYEFSISQICKKF